MQWSLLQTVSLVRICTWLILNMFLQSLVRVWKFCWLKPQKGSAIPCATPSAMQRIQTQTETIRDHVTTRLLQANQPQCLHSSPHRLYVRMFAAHSCLDPRPARRPTTLLTRAMLGTGIHATQVQCRPLAGALASEPCPGVPSWQRCVAGSPDK